MFTFINKPKHWNYVLHWKFDIENHHQKATTFKCIGQMSVYFFFWYKATARLIMRHTGMDHWWTWRNAKLQSACKHLIDRTIFLKLYINLWHTNCTYSYICILLYRYIHFNIKQHYTDSVSLRKNRSRHVCPHTHTWRSLFEYSGWRSL